MAALEQVITRCLNPMFARLDEIEAELATVLCAMEVRSSALVKAQPSLPAPKAPPVPAPINTQVLTTAERNHALLERYLTDPTSTMTILGREFGLSVGRVSDVLRYAATQEGRSEALAARTA